MDVFLFTSIFEGFGIVLVEAQCSGAPCVVADSNIPKNVKLSDDFYFVSLKETSQYWADHIIKLHKRERVGRTEEAKLRGFDINTVSEWLEKFYLKRGKS